MYWSKSIIPTADEVLSEIENDERRGERNVYRISEEDITERISNIEESMYELEMELDRRKYENGGRKKFDEIYNLVKNYSRYSYRISSFKLIIGGLSGAFAITVAYSMYEELCIKGKIYSASDWKGALTLLIIPLLISIMFLPWYFKERSKYKRNHVRTKKDFESYLRENPKMFQYCNILICDYAEYMHREQVAWMEKRDQEERENAEKEWLEKQIENDERWERIMHER